MDRTLYLNENKGLRVSRDGPSLLIKADGGAAQRVPIRLVGRVVIIGNVKLEAGAITLFTEHHIPVVFINRSGEESAVAIPYNHRLPKHYEEQRVFLSSEKNISRYKNFANVKRMNIQMQVLNRMFNNNKLRLPHEIGEGNYEILINNFKPKDREKWHIVSEVVNNLLRSIIISSLLKADLDPHIGVIHRRHNFGLALDICYIMGAESDIQCIQFFRSANSNLCFGQKEGRLEITEHGMKDLIHRFENRLKALQNMIEGIIDELFELMRELRA